MRSFGHAPRARPAKCFHFVWKFERVGVVNRGDLYDILKQRRRSALWVVRHFEVMASRAGKRACGSSE
ncbi:hypothetical protein MTO96_046278 [Rhipicephalus appendiculatus]